RPLRVTERRVGWTLVVLVTTGRPGVLPRSQPRWAESLRRAARLWGRPGPDAGLARASAPAPPRRRPGGPAGLARRRYSAGGPPRSVRTPPRRAPAGPRHPAARPRRAAPPRRPAAARRCRRAAAPGTVAWRRSGPVRPPRAAPARRPGPSSLPPSTVSPVAAEHVCQDTAERLDVWRRRGDSTDHLHPWCGPFVARPNGLPHQPRHHDPPGGPARRVGGRHGHHAGARQRSAGRLHR